MEVLLNRLSCPPLPSPPKKKKKNNNNDLTDQGTELDVKTDEEGVELYIYLMSEPMVCGRPVVCTYIIIRTDGV